MLTQPEGGLLVKRSEPLPSVFRALADPTRREILKMLRKGALNSGEIASRFDATWPTISRHLAVLRAAGLVRSVRHKQGIRYELNTSVLQDLAQHLIELGASMPHAQSKPRKARRSRARLQEA
jgi:ArsR family transcriptional regulator, arsenate/arsenite/antimonite-responsive transcriptional repressor